MRDEEIRRELKSRIRKILRKNNRPPSMHEAARILGLVVPNPTEEQLKKSIEDMGLVNDFVTVFAIIYKLPKETRLLVDTDSRSLARSLCTAFDPSTEVYLRELVLTETSIEKGLRKEDYRDRHNFYVTSDLPRTFIFPLVEALHEIADQVRSAYLIKRRPRPRIHDLKRILEYKKERLEERERALVEGLEEMYGSVPLEDLRDYKLPLDYVFFLRRLDILARYAKNFDSDDRLLRIVESELDGVERFYSPEISDHPKFRYFLLEKERFEEQLKRE